MRIYNAKIFQNGAFLPGGIEFDTQIRACGEEIVSGDLDAQGAYLIPGLIDIHTHGAVGKDASDGKEEGLSVLARFYAAGGVTSWCPTTMTLPEPVLLKAMETIRHYRRPADGAKIAGVNLEGPFLSYAKRGAQAAKHLHAPDAALFYRLYAASGKQIRLVTIAPEEPGALAFIGEISPVCTVSLGHTTADYDTAMAAYATGAMHTTHLFNAMPPLLHRAPGVIGAAYDSGATAELICDSLHIHPAVVRLAFALFGKNLVLVSDSLRCTGMPDGDYLLGGQAITLKNKKAVLTGTETLAGSCIHLMDSLRMAVRFGVPLEQAVTAATLAPARAIHMEHEIGSLKPGLAADFLLLDNKLNLKAVYIDGTSIPD